MNPVIPRIRVGDVLHGTKNLRNYLRTCSLLRYIKAVEQGYSNQEDLRKILYTPNKKDTFVVSVNNLGKFCAWSPNMDVVMAFVDANNPQAFDPNSHRMSPKTFAQWFIRTPGRHPNVSKWPVYAHYMWAALQINAWRNPQVAKYLPNHHHLRDRETNPFQFAQLMSPEGMDHTTINQIVRDTIKQGLFRDNPKPKRGSADLFSGIGFGPLLKDLPELRKSLEVYMSDSRIMSKVKKEKGFGPVTLPF